MAETEEQKKGKKLGLSRPGKPELKNTVETVQVRQNFSHGRSRMVTVEVRKKRTFAPDAGGHMAEVPVEEEVTEEVEAPEEKEQPGRTSYWLCICFGVLEWLLLYRCCGSLSL